LHYLLGVCFCFLLIDVFCYQVPICTRVIAAKAFGELLVDFVLRVNLQDIGGLLEYPRKLPLNVNS